MQIHVLVAPVFATNCLVVVAGDGSEGNDAIVIDAGAGVADAAHVLIERNKWQLQAVLATHGHADHTWDAGVLCEHFNVPFYIHQADAYRIADPFGSLTPKGAAPDLTVATAIKQLIKELGQTEADYRPPAHIQTFTAAPGEVLTAGDIKLELIHAPGHTEGSTIYVSEPITPPSAASDGASADGGGAAGASAGSNSAGANGANGADSGGAEANGAGADASASGAPRSATDRELRVAFTGDVLFSGSVGRTDLPGGSYLTMEKTLERLKTELDPSWGILPGHGSASTVAFELANNPYF